MNTQVSNSARNRPTELQNSPDEVLMGLKHETVIRGLTQAVKSGMSPKEVAGSVFDGIKDKKLYILTNLSWKFLIENRTKNILKC